MIIINKNITFIAVFALLLSGIAPSFADDESSLTGWAKLGEQKTIQLVNLKEYTQDNFSKNRGRDDDLVEIDYCDYKGHNKITATREKNEVKLSGKVEETKYHPEFHVQGKVNVESENRLLYMVTAEAEKDNVLKDPYISIRLSQGMLDRPITLVLRTENGHYKHELIFNAERDGGWIWSSPAETKVYQVVISMMHGALTLSGFEGKAIAMKWGENTGNLRIVTVNGEVDKSDCKMDISFAPIESQALNFRDSANMGFEDTIAADRKGGWTDQGPENDLSDITIGQNKFANIVFDIIDPQSNNGKSILAFANKERPYFLDKAQIEVNAEKSSNYLYLLNTAAWCRGGGVGTIKVFYSDGSTSEYTVQARRDVADWWNPEEGFKNAVPVWKTKRRANEFRVIEADTGDDIVGLYLSRYPLKNLPVSKVSFATANNAVWIIVGASLVQGEPVFPENSDQEIPYIVKEGADWKSFQFSKEIIKDSALDFSTYLDAPAGKYGRMIVKGENFEFENRPGVSQRFLGLNTTEDSAYLKKADTEKFVSFIAKRGYNLVRLHHFDQNLAKPENGILKLDPELLDRMFYYIAKLKEHGIYITLDLYTARTIGFDKNYKNMFDVKSRALFHKPIRDNIMEFGRLLLTTVNPYTGLALKDDPVLTTIGLINEDPLFTHHNQYKYPNADPEQNELIKIAFEDWCGRKKLDPAMLDKQMWVHFVIDRHIEAYNEMKEYLRSIGIKNPLSDVSCSIPFPLSVVRNHFDYVDNHTYIDHPAFLGGAFKLPYYITDVNAINNFAPKFTAVASTRIMGKPFTLTEYNFCAPSRYRYEDGPLVGGIASLQNWNSIVRFGFQFSYKWKIDPLADGGFVAPFSVFNDPIRMLSEYIVSMLYLRGDVRSSKCESVACVPENVWKFPQASGYMDWDTRENALLPASFNRLAFYGKIGTVISEEESKNGKYSLKKLLDGNEIVSVQRNGNGIFDPNAGRIVSDTGEMETNIRTQTIRVVSPRSEALALIGESLNGNILTVSGNTAPATFFAGSIDGNLLQKSKRILVFHLTDIKASGQKLAIFKSTIRMYNFGKVKPHLLKNGQATVSLRLGEGEFMVRSLDLNGATLEDLDSILTNGVLSFTADTMAGPTGKAVMIYEITKLN